MKKGQVSLPQQIIMEYVSMSHMLGLHPSGAGKSAGACPVVGMTWS